MNQFNQILTGILLAFMLTACCTSKKPTQPPAREALPDRNTKDPKLNNNPPKVELKDSM